MTGSRHLIAVVTAQLLLLARPCNSLYRAAGKVKKGEQPRAVEPPSHGTVWIARTYPPWQATVLTTLRQMHQVRARPPPPGYHPRTDVGLWLLAWPLHYNMRYCRWEV